MLHGRTITTPTPTGFIFHNEFECKEWLVVGDYGKQANIKADFLGLTRRIYGVPHSPVNFSDKCVITISTQAGCAMDCRFCDVPIVGYHGNNTAEEMNDQVVYALQYVKARKLFTNNHTERLNIHYARMGEPAFNMDNVLVSAMTLPSVIPITYGTFHPVVSTMLPKSLKNQVDDLREWCNYKNNVQLGEAGLQLSINSTSDEQRDFQFRGLSLSLSEIAAIAEKLPHPRGRKYTLNFAITEKTILDPKVLSLLFDREKFIVKITPTHQTHAAAANQFDVSTTYVDYAVYEKYEEPLLAEGWDVIVFVPSREEDESRITCGNALLGDRWRENEC